MSYTEVIRDDFVTTPLKSAREKAIEKLESKSLAQPQGGDQAQRETLKRWIAQGELAEQQLNGIRMACSEIEAKKDELACQHTEACRPLQVELDSIEKKQMAAILAREPHDEALENRRSQLLDELHRLNIELERAIAYQDAKREQLEPARIEAALRVPTNGGLRKRQLFALGHPRLLAAHALAKHDHRAAEERLSLLSDPMLATDSETLAAAAAEVERTSQIYDAAYDAVVTE